MSQENPKDFSDQVANFTNTADSTSEFDQQDINKNKGMAILAYIGILVLIPIFAAKESKYAQFHANQGLVLFVCEIICSVISMIPFIGLVAYLLEILLFVLFIIGIINAASGKAKELPIIGGFKLIKY